MKRPEQALQQHVYKYIRYAAPHVLCFHVPNSARRGKLEGYMFKLMGVLPGVADLLLFWPDYYQTIAKPIPKIAAIELKYGKGKQTDHQKEFEQRWKGMGGHYAVCTSIDEVEVNLKNWGAI